MNCLGLLLKEGWESQSWIIFLDKEFQTIYEDFDQEYFKTFKSVYKGFELDLDENCRNTPEIIKKAHIHTGLDEIFCLKPNRLKPELKFYESFEELFEQIEDVVKELIDDGVEPSSITVLTNNDKVGRITSRKPGLYSNLRQNECSFPKDKVILSTPHSFKGLENDFVIYTGNTNFSPNDRRQLVEFYVSYTRAITMENKFLEVRDEIRQLIEKTLRGPLFGEDEVLQKSPRDFYLTGIIYPQTTNEVDFEAISEGSEDEHGGVEDEDTETSPNADSGSNAGDSSSEEDFDELIMTTDFKPSAFGISVMTDLNADFLIKATAGCYAESIKPDRKEELDELIEEGAINPKYIPSEFKQYERDQVGIEGYRVSVSEKEIKLFTPKGDLEGSHHKIVKVSLDENLSLHITKRDLTRKSIDKNIITLTLVNELTVTEKSELYDPQLSFFQPKIEAYSDKLTFSSFDDYTDLSKIKDQEELNLKLLYKDYQSYGTGHGAAVSWQEPDKNLQKTKRVESQIIPLYEVKGNDFEPHELIKRDENDDLVEDCEILYMKRLAGKVFHGKDEKPVNKDELIRELRDFSGTYGEWIKKQDGKIDSSIDRLRLKQDYKDRLVKRAKKNLDICQYLKSRMDKGIDLIAENEMVYRAFSDANKAMFMQRAMNTFA